MKKIILSLILVLVPSSVFAQSVPFPNNLHYGSRGEEVVALQEFLFDQGMFTGEATGNFYSITLKAVKAFQKAQGITPISGYVGPITRGLINQILSEQTMDSEGEATVVQIATELSQPQLIPQKTPENSVSNVPSVAGEGVPTISVQIAEGVDARGILGGNCEIAKITATSNTTGIYSFISPEGGVQTNTTGIFRYKPTATSTIQTLQIALNGQSTTTAQLKVIGSLYEVELEKDPQGNNRFVKFAPDLWNSKALGVPVNPLTGQCI